MSLLEYAEAVNAPDLQIWNNNAFDDGETNASTSIKASSWCPLQPVFISKSKTPYLDSFKENKSPVPLEPSIPIKPAESKGKPLKLLFKQGLLSPSLNVPTNENEATLDECKIETEIEEIEIEINRLSSKLEALSVEKADQNLKTTENPEKIQKKIEGNLTANPSSKIKRRGVSLGPTEIMASVRSRPPVKPEITPIKSSQQSRRKSCFFKLQESEEEKVIKERGGRSSSLSPISRRSVSKPQNSKQAFTTVGSKKQIKKDEIFLSSIQPKKLFKEGENFVGAKKPIKNGGRVVASRYNQISSAQSTQKKIEQWKKLWPESDKRCAYSVGKSTQIVQERGMNPVNEVLVKKHWEIPCNNLMDSPSSSILKMADLLPKIKTIRCTEVHSPRDSGAAKRVAELIEKKSYFSAESNELDYSVCQALDFDDEL